MTGIIRKKITSPVPFKGYVVRASIDEPQYLIESETTTHLAMHKGTALRLLTKRRAKAVKSRSR